LTTFKDAAVLSFAKATGKPDGTAIPPGRRRFPNLAAADENATRKKTPHAFLFPTGDGEKTNKKRFYLQKMRFFSKKRQKTASGDLQSTTSAW